MAKPLNQFGGWLRFFQISNWIWVILNIFSGLGFVIMALSEGMFHPIMSSLFLFSATYLTIQFLRIIKDQSKSTPTKVSTKLTWIISLAIIFGSCEIIMVLQGSNWTWTQEAHEALMPYFQAIVSLLIWIIYFSISKRVNAYYGENSQNSVSRIWAVSSLPEEDIQGEKFESQKTERKLNKIALVVSIIIIIGISLKILVPNYLLLTQISIGNLTSRLMDIMWVLPNKLAGILIDFDRANNTVYVNPGKFSQLGEDGQQKFSWLAFKAIEEGKKESRWLSPEWNSSLLIKSKNPPKLLSEYQVKRDYEVYNQNFADDLSVADLYELQRSVGYKDLLSGLDRKNNIAYVRSNLFTNLSEQLQASFSMLVLNDLENLKPDGIGNTAVGSAKLTIKDYDTDIILGTYQIKMNYIVIENGSLVAGE